MQHLALYYSHLVHLIFFKDNFNTNWVMHNSNFWEEIESFLSNKILKFKNKTRGKKTQQTEPVASWSWCHFPVGTDQADQGSSPGYNTTTIWSTSQSGKQDRISPLMMNIDFPQIPLLPTPNSVQIHHCSQLTVLLEPYEVVLLEHHHRVITHNANCLVAQDKFQCTFLRHTLFQRMGATTPFQYSSYTPHVSCMCC